MWNVETKDPKRCLVAVEKICYIVIYFNRGSVSTLKTFIYYLGTHQILKAFVFPFIYIYMYVDLPFSLRNDAIVSMLVIFWESPIHKFYPDTALVL